MLKWGWGLCIGEYSNWLVRFSILVSYGLNRRLIVIPPCAFSLKSTGYPDHTLWALCCKRYMPTFQLNFQFFSKLAVDNSPLPLTDTDYTRKPQLVMSHPNNILSIQPANTTPSSVPNIIMSRLARLRQLMSRPIITHVSIRPSMLLTLLMVLCTRNPGKSICICSPHPTWAAIQLRARDLQLSAHQIIANRYPKSQ